MIEQIVVTAALPPAPFVLVDSAFMAALALCEAKTGAIKIIDQASAQAAGSLLGQLTRHGTDLEKARKALKEPFLEIGRKIDTTAQVAASRIDFSKRVLKNSLASWEEIQFAKAREIERARQEELARLEKERVREAEEAARKAAEIAASAVQTDLDLTDLDFDLEPAPKTEIEKKIEEVKFAPVVATAKPKGVRSELMLKFKVADLNALPEPFIIRTANERLVRETYCVGWKEGAPMPSVPGVNFYTDRVISSTGRSTEPEVF